MVIERPPEEVFGFLADLENWPRWQPDIVRSELTLPGPLGAGTTFRQAIDVGGRKVELLCEVIGYEQDRKLSFDYTNDGLFFTLNFHFAPASTGTRVTGEGEGQLSGFLSLFEPVVGREVDEQVKTGLCDLKRLMEA